MSAAGIQPESPVAIYSPNDARVLFCMLGLLRAGGVWVPINYRNAADANIEYLNYVEASWLFYHSSFRDSVREIKSRVPSLATLHLHRRRMRWRRITRKHSCVEARLVTFPIFADAHGNPDDLMGLVPTGGTTGPAKGVMVTNVAWGTMVELAGHYWRIGDANPVCLSTAPLSHAAGTVAFAMFPLGATNVVLPKFDALEVLKSIERFGVTHIFLPPTAFYALLAHPDLERFNYSSLRVFLLAAAPVSPDKLKRGIEVFGPCLCQCYGQTEAPMLLTWLDQRTLAAAAAGDHPERLRSCGRASSAVRLAVMDDDGHILPPHQPGEIVARGSLVTLGYYKLPEATNEIRTFGWHHTGDIGYRDEFGFFYIVDRKKDMIISGGFNVYCAEVEAAVMELPEVRECAVIGVPDDKWGEAVKAIVVLRDGDAISEDLIIAHCKTRLGGVKAPKSIEFRAEIPKTAAAKTDKKALRQPLLGQSRAKRELT